MRVNVDVEDFLSVLELANRSANTIKNYEDLLGMFFAYIKKDSVDKVTKRDVKRFLLENKEKRCWKHNTYAMYVSKLRRFFKNRKKDVYNLLRDVNIALKDTDTESFEKEEILALAQYFKKRRPTGWWHMETVYYTIHLFLAATGARVGAVCSLNVGDIEYVKDGLWIHFRAETTKTGRGRDFLLSCESPLAYPTLLEYLKTERGKAKLGDPLFVNNLGRRLRPYSIQRQYRHARRALGIRKKCTPHVNRHTYTNKQRQEHDEAVAASITGHSVRTLLTTYTHITEKERIEAMKKVIIV